MITADIVQKVKELEIHTRRLLRGSVIGGNRSRQKGFGFEFDQLRSYQYGDDVRLIDWKSSARNPDNVLVRQYFEERNRTFMICLDISPSTMFGSGDYLKIEIMQQVAGALALAGQWSKDKVGLILFSDRIEKVVMPAKGHVHVHQLLTTMFAHKPEGKGTDFHVLCDYIAAHVPKRSMLFLVSDFIGKDFSESLKKVSFDKDVIAISFKDPQEEMLADVGYVWMKDPETSEVALVHTSGSSAKKLGHGLQSCFQEQKSLMNKMGVDVLYLKNQNSFMQDLVLFFQKRMM